MSLGMYIPMKPTHDQKSNKYIHHLQKFLICPTFFLCGNNTNEIYSLNLKKMHSTVLLTAGILLYSRIL